MRTKAKEYSAFTAMLNSQRIRIPLFPLDIAVLPGQVVPLHIFEERYKNLVHDCTVNGVGEVSRRFGIARVEGEQIVTYGSTMRVEEILRRHTDGRLDILCVGEQRFKLENIWRDREYFEADVLLLAEDLTVESELRAKVVHLHRELALLAGARVTELNENSPYLAFSSAVSLGLDDNLRQQLLTLKAERDRLVWLIDVYTEVKEELSQNNMAKLSKEEIQSLKYVH